MNSTTATAVRQLVSDFGPVRLTLGQLSIFPNHAGEKPADVLKVDVQSEDLVRLNALLAEKLPHAGIHTNFSPHLTIAYLRPGVGRKYIGRPLLEGTEIICRELTFSDRDGSRMTIPLETKAGSVLTNGRKSALNLQADPREEWEEPLFTGTDSHGHKWVNGRQVAREKEQGAGRRRGTTQPAATSETDPHATADEQASGRIASFAKELAAATLIPRVAHHLKSFGALCKNMTTKLYGGLEKRYGKATAVACLASGQVFGWGVFGIGAAIGIPLYIPGSTLLGQIPAVVMAEMYHQAKGSVGKSYDGVDANVVKREGVALCAAVEKAFKSAVESNKDMLVKDFMAGAKTTKSAAAPSTTMPPRDPEKTDYFTGVAANGHHYVQGRQVTKEDYDAHTAGGGKQGKPTKPKRDAQAAHLESAVLAKLEKQGLPHDKLSSLAEKVHGLTVEQLAQIAGHAGKPTDEPASKPSAKPAPAKPAPAIEKPAHEPAEAKPSPIAAEPHTPPPPGQVYAPDVEEDSTGNGVTDAARIGVPAMDVPPPPPIGRLPNLTELERSVEDDFIAQVEKDADGAAHKFLEIVRGGAKPGEPPTFGTDDAKVLSPAWTNPDQATRSQNRATLNCALHQTANAVAKRAFLMHLDTLQKGDGVMVTVGGCGSGKGWNLGNVPEVLAMKMASKAVFDSAGDQNATENPWIQQEAEKRGLKVTYAFVHADPHTQWAHPDRGVVKRAADPKDGRMVDAKVFADSYALGAKNHQAFYEGNKDNPAAKFVFLANGAKIDGIPKEALSLDRHELAEFAANVVKTGDAPAHVKRGATIGERIWPETNKPAVGA